MTQYLKSHSYLMVLFAGLISWVIANTIDMTDLKLEVFVIFFAPIVAVLVSIVI